MDSRGGGSGFVVVIVIVGVVILIGDDAERLALQTLVEALAVASAVSIGVGLALFGVGELRGVVVGGTLVAADAIDEASVVTVFVARIERTASVARDEHAIHRSFTAGRVGACGIGRNGRGVGSLGSIGVRHVLKRIARGEALRGEGSVGGELLQTDECSCRGHEDDGKEDGTDDGLRARLRFVIFVVDI